MQWLQLVTSDEVLNDIKMKGLETKGSLQNAQTVSFLIPDKGVQNLTYFCNLWDIIWRFFGGDLFS